ncbi:MAG: ABC transporter substrate-binding protein [Candidatus Poribacteria bacterium]|nr:ABC transporter substrate-binding protein [Candidatus Poribacteria bacterium]
MIHKRNPIALKCCVVSGILASFFLMVVFFSGCQRIQQFIAPTDLETPDNKVTVKIGFLYSPPDPGTTRNGAELAVALANEAGGINGLPIELLIRDDKRDPALSVQYAKELIDAGVSAIVGPDYSVLAMDVGKIAQEHGIPMVTTYPTNPKVPESGNFSFMGAFTDPYQADVMADFAVGELVAETAAVLTETGSAYSEGLTDVFIEEFTAQGGTIEVDLFYEAGTTDFTEQLMAIAAVEPAIDVVFLPGLGPEFLLAVKQTRAADLNIPATFLGGDGWDRPDLVEIAGMAAEGSFFANHFSAGGTPEQLGKEASQFIADYTSRFGIAPDGPASLGYDAANIIIEAMRRAPNLTPAAIRDQIQATQNYKGATVLSHFDENRHAIKSTVINTVKDGKIQLHTAITP